MRRLLAVILGTLALAIPSTASATEVPPLPPALMCAQYHATEVCVLLDDTRPVYMWTTPWYSGVTYGMPIPWPAREDE